jgi:chromosome partitioning protein
MHLDRRPELEARTITHALVEDVPLAELILPTRTDGLSLIPADTSLAGVEQVLSNRIGRETILREAFEALAATRSFEYALIDCPPALGVLSANALVAAEEVLVPLQTEYFALQGIAKLVEVVELVRRRLNPALRIAGIVPTMVDVRSNLTNEVLAEIQHHFGTVCTRARIRQNVKLAEAPSFGRTIFEHAPDCHGARDYETLAVELEGETAVPVRGVRENGGAAGLAAGS